MFQADYSTSEHPTLSGVGDHSFFLQIYFLSAPRSQLTLIVQNSFEDGYWSVVLACALTRYQISVAVWFRVALRGALPGIMQTAAGLGIQLGIDHSSPQFLHLSSCRSPPQVPSSVAGSPRHACLKSVNSSFFRETYKQMHEWRTGSEDAEFIPALTACTAAGKISLLCNLLLASISARHGRPSFRSPFDVEICSFMALVGVRCGLVCSQSAVIKAAVAATEGLERLATDSFSSMPRPAEDDLKMSTVGR